MPELPDLEVFSHNLNKRLKGRIVKNIQLYPGKKTTVTLHELKENLEGQTLKNITREGKELHIHFGNKQILGLHLMLKGQLHINEIETEVRGKIIELVFEDETSLVMSDFMKMALPTLNPEPVKAPDAMSEKVNAGFLKKQLQESKENIKSYLLDQKKIRGIGNAYADEILWDARISPFSLCDKIPDIKIKQLASSIKFVLSNAKKQILQINPDLITGEVREFMKVHTAKKSHTDTGQVIHSKELKSRKTYYTNEQELYK
ncbi:MAG: DNA-formamidopyrimidine glycosylase family protein [Chitinophagaceae bacterium]